VGTAKLANTPRRMFSPSSKSSEFETLGGGTEPAELFQKPEMTDA
jgi:hypothetical protein